MSLPRTRRVLRSSEYREVYSKGIRMTSRYFAAFCLHSPSDEPLSRFGFTVPRAIGKAVKRNRIKRRMRQAVGLQMNELGPSWAVVFNPRRSVIEAPFDDLCREIGRVFARCGK